MNVKALLVAAVLLCAVAAAAAVKPQVKQQQLEKKVMAGAVDGQTKEIEVAQLKALLAQIDQDHGRATPEPVLEKEAKGVLKTLEKGEESSEESSDKAAAAEESSEESSSAAAEESSEESSSATEAEESSEESSQKAAAETKKTVAELHRELAALMLKKTSGTVKGEELERVNTEIELLLQKIRKAQAIETPKPEAPKNGTRNEVEKLADLVLAHLTTLREGRGDFAALHAVDVEDMAVNLRALADKADDYKGGRAACTGECAEQKPAAPCEGKDECGNPVVQPEIKNPCEGPKCEKKVVVEAEEKKCGDEPCAAAAKPVAKMTVVAASKNSTAASHPVVPKTVHSCEKDSSNSSCGAESKSPVSLCKPCAEKRDACHAKCEEKKCADKCHAEVSKCSCGTNEVRTDVVKPSSEQVNGCEPNGSGACKNVKPTMVKKGELSDKKAAKFFF